MDPNPRFLNSPLHYIVILLALSALAGLVQFGMITLMLRKLNLSLEMALLLLTSSIVGSFVNIPLFSMKAPTTGGIRGFLTQLLTQLQPRLIPRTEVAVNVGGCVIPAIFSVYLSLVSPIDLVSVLLATALVAAITYRLSRVVKGVGFTIPALAAPLSAALIALFLADQQSAPLAYIASTLGVLIGADLMHLQDIPKLGARRASIGGAGLFDGIFLSGIFAVLLV